MQGVIRDAALPMWHIVKKRCEIKRTLAVQRIKEETVNNSWIFPVLLVDSYGARRIACYYDMMYFEHKLVDARSVIEWKLSLIEHGRSILNQFHSFDMSLSVESSDMCEYFNVTNKQIQDMPALYVTDNVEVAHKEITRKYNEELYRLTGACIAHSMTHINNFIATLLGKRKNLEEFTDSDICIYNGLISKLCACAINKSIENHIKVASHSKSVCNDHANTHTEIHNRVEDFHHHAENVTCFSESKSAEKDCIETLTSKTQHNMQIDGVCNTIELAELNLCESKYLDQSSAKDIFAIALALAINRELPRLSAHTAKQLVKMINTSSSRSVLLFVDKLKEKDEEVAAFQSCATQLTLRLRKECQLLHANQNKTLETVESVACNNVAEDINTNNLFSGNTLNSSSTLNETDLYRSNSGKDIEDVLTDESEEKLICEHNETYGTNKPQQLSDEESVKLLQYKLCTSSEQYNIDPWVVHFGDANAIWQWAKANVPEELTPLEKATKMMSIIEQRRLLPGRLSVTLLSTYCMCNLERNWWGVLLNNTKSIRAAHNNVWKDHYHVRDHETKSNQELINDVNKQWHELPIENDFNSVMTRLALRDVRRNIIDTHFLFYYAQLLREGRVEVQHDFHAFIDECGECYSVEERPSKIEFTLSRSYILSLQTNTKLTCNASNSCISVIACDEHQSTQDKKTTTTTTTTAATATANIINNSKLLDKTNTEFLQSQTGTNTATFVNVSNNTFAFHHNDSVNANKNNLSVSRSLSMLSILRSLAPLSAYWCTLLDYFPHLIHVVTAPCSELRVNVELPTGHECLREAYKFYEEPVQKEPIELKMECENECECVSLVSQQEHTYEEKCKHEQKVIVRKHHQEQEEEWEQVTPKSIPNRLHDKDTKDKVKRNKITEPLEHTCTLTSRLPNKEWEHHSRLPLGVLYEDADVLVIDKPANIATCHHALCCTQMQTAFTDVVSLLLASPEYSFLATVPRQGKVHRLDQETSGCLLFAKNDSAYDVLRHQMGTSASFELFNKSYLALCVVLEPNLEHIPLNGILTDANEQRIKSKYRVVEFFAFARVVLVECKLQQGKKHQLRRHLAAAGLPIVGDVEHGGAVCCQPYINRVALHARSLQFIHPTTNTSMRVISPLPFDFELALKHLQSSNEK